MTADAKNVRSIFLAAVENHDPAQWSAFLDDACRGDDDLRRRVEVLLQAHRQANSLLDAPAIATIPEPATEKPGTMVGPYKLLERIGEGGFGVVYMAEQREPMRRRVALKLLKPGMDTRQVIARFEAERQALAIMDHPNIAKVFDGGETGGARDEGRGPSERDSVPRLLPPDSRPYFVMELVKGASITEYCDLQRLSIRQRLEHFVTVCQAVQHAHQKGIIHRDLKPANILVASHDGTPVVKVIDFGIAKAMSGSLTDKTVFTGFAQLIGTPLYMSPEQAGQSSLDVDTRSDIYSLGVLLYELLTGTTPFDRETLSKLGYDEMRRVIREEEPPRPSSRISTLGQAASTVSTNRQSDPAKLSRQIRGELDWIVMKALEKDRNRRYETANGLAMEVQRYLADEPVQACPPSAWYRIRKFVRRNRARVTVAAGMLLAVTVIAATIGWGVRDHAAREAESLQRETARRDALAIHVRASLNMARILLAENRVAAARHELAAARAELVNDRSALSELAAEVDAGDAELARLQRFVDMCERASQATTAPALETEFAVGDSPGSVRTAPTKSTVDRRLGAAVGFYLQALECYDVLKRVDWHTSLEGGLLGRELIEDVRGSVYDGLLWLASDVGSRHKAHHSGEELSRELAARQALDYLAKAESAGPPTQTFYALRADFREVLGEKAGAQADREWVGKTVPTAPADYFLHGRKALDAKQRAEAVRAFEAALRLAPTSYSSMLWLGNALCDLGRGPEDFESAARVFTGCILKRPDHAYAYVSRATACLKLGRYEDARADCCKAIELDANHAHAWNQRGTAYLKMGQPDRAVADFTKAIELKPTLVEAWNNRAAAYQLLAQYDKAVADFSKTIELDPNLPNPWCGRGLVYLKLDQPDKAIAELTKAIALGAPAWNDRGRAHVELRQWDKALEDFSKAIEVDPKNAKAWNHRGGVYCEHFRKYDDALVDCTKAIELDPTLAEAWHNRGAAYGQLGWPDKSIEDFSEALRLDSKLAQAWGNRGATYMQLEQWDKALPDLTKYIELAPPKDPRVALAYLLRARANSRLAHFTQARSDFESVLKRKPPSAGLFNELAWLLATCPDAKVRDPRRAVELAEKAVELTPKAGNYWTTLGAAHYRAGDWKAAVAALDKSVELRKGGDAFDHFFLAMAQQQLGAHRDEARRAYDQAIQWLEKNEEKLKKDESRRGQLRRLRSEAEEVLELKKK